MKRALKGIARLIVAAGLTASCGGSVGAPSGHDGGSTSRDGGPTHRDGGHADVVSVDAACPQSPTGTCASEGQQCPALCGACTCTSGTWECPEPPCAEPCRGPAPHEGDSCGGTCCGPSVGLTCDFDCGDGGQASATCEGSDAGGIMGKGAWHLQSACAAPEDAGSGCPASCPPGQVIVNFNDSAPGFPGPSGCACQSAPCPDGGVACSCDSACEQLGHGACCNWAGTTLTCNECG
jgi:hypothetical protein